MQTLQSLRQVPPALFASNDVMRPEFAQHSPRQNQLLAALPPGDYERLLPYLEPVSLAQGWTIHDAGERDKYLYFLTAGVVSRFYVTESGASAEFALTGSEGVIGLAAILGGESMPTRAVVQSAGHAYRLSAGVLKSKFRRDHPLQNLLLRYVQALIAQTGQVAACNRHHTLEQQLCRWMLSSLDRLPSDELAMTHELIGHMLGVRRESITQALGNLQRAGLIHCSRGQIAVLDRPGVEARACECHSIIKREYDRLAPGYLHAGLAA
jgi:CRP-like cAMP-binding protein